MSLYRGVPSPAAHIPTLPGGWGRLAPFRRSGWACFALREGSGVPGIRASSGPGAGSRCAGSLVGPGALAFPVKADFFSLRGIAL